MNIKDLEIGFTELKNKLGRELWLESDEIPKEEEIILNEVGRELRTMGKMILNLDHRLREISKSI